MADDEILTGQPLAKRSDERAKAHAAAMPARTPTDWFAEEHHELIARITAAVRRADKVFESNGGSSRHWVRECFLPELEAEGLKVTNG